MAEMDELDREILEQPYRRLAAAEEHSEITYLLKVYENSYQSRYKSKYIHSLGNADRVIISDIKKMAGDKTAKLLEHYLSMREPWFEQMRHSLEVLKRNLNKVCSDYESRQGRPQVTSVVLSLNISCDRCGRHFTWQTDPTKISSERVCKNCLQT